MAGETDLKKLLRNMAPVLVPGEYVFCTLAAGQNLPEDAAIGRFREAEGMTVIIEKAVADEYRLAYHGSMAWITLSVHSSLEAVGLTAAVAGVLAQNDISCNVVAAYYHDHIFVPVGKAERTMTVLQELSQA